MGESFLSSIKSTNGGSGSALLAQPSLSLFSYLNHLKDWCACQEENSNCKSAVLDDERQYYLRKLYSSSSRRQQQRRSGSKKQSPSSSQRKKSKSNTIPSKITLFSQENQEVNNNIVVPSMITVFHQEEKAKISKHNSSNSISLSETFDYHQELFDKSHQELQKACCRTSDSSQNDQSNPKIIQPLSPSCHERESTRRKQNDEQNSTSQGSADIPDSSDVDHADDSSLPSVEQISCSEQEDDGGGNDLEELDYTSQYHVGRSSSSSDDSSYDSPVPIAAQPSEEEDNEDEVEAKGDEGSWSSYSSVASPPLQHVTSVFYATSVDHGDEHCYEEQQNFTELRSDENAILEDDSSLELDVIEERSVSDYDNHTSDRDRCSFHSEENGYVGHQNVQEEGGNMKVDFTRTVALNTISAFVKHSGIIHPEDKEKTIPCQTKVRTNDVETNKFDIDRIIDFMKDNDAIIKAIDKSISLATSDAESDKTQDALHQMGISSSTSRLTSSIGTACPDANSITGRIGDERNTEILDPSLNEIDLMASSGLLDIEQFISDLHDDDILAKDSLFCDVRSSNDIHECDEDEDDDENSKKANSILKSELEAIDLWEELRRRPSNNNASTNFL